jgi:hypothetical protein
MITPKRLVHGIALANDYNDALYTVPTSVLSATVKQLIVCNTSAVGQTFSYQVRLVTEVSAVSVTEFDSVSLATKETKIFGLTDVLPTGASIFAKASNGAVVSLTISGMEVT